MAFSTELPRPQGRQRPGPRGNMWNGTT